MISVRPPSTDAARVHRPFLKIHSSPMQSKAAPQPMNTAEEYRFVTGGRPVRYMRKHRDSVCTTITATASQYADFDSGPVMPNQLRQMSKNTPAYRSAAFSNGMKWLKKTSNFALAASPETFSRRYFVYSATSWL